MKKRIKMLNYKIKLFFLLLVLAAIYGSIHASNYILNPDFESQGISEEQESRMEYWASDFDTTLSTTNVHSGLQSMAVDEIDAAGKVAYYPTSFGYDHIIERLRKLTPPDMYKSMQIKFGGYIKAEAGENPPESLYIKIGLKRDNNTWMTDITDNIYDFDAGDWQLLSGEKIWTPSFTGDDTLRFQIGVLTNEAFGSVNDKVYLDDFFILPNFFPEPDFQRDAYNFSDYFSTTNCPAYYGYEMKDEIALGNQYLQLEADHDSIGLYGNIVRYNSEIINIKNLNNRVFDFQYDLKLDDYAEYDTVVNTISSTFYMVDNNKKDRTAAYGGKYNYWTTEDTSWQTLGYSISIPDSFTGNDRKATFYLTQSKYSYETPDSNHKYGLDNLKLYERIPVMPEIVSGSNIGRIYPVFKVNPSYPGEIDTDSVMVELVWDTDNYTNDGYVDVWKTGSNDTLTFYEDLDFIPKQVHRVTGKIKKETNLHYRITVPGIDRGFTRTQSYNLPTSIPNYTNSIESDTITIAT
jgi:hypothetical protein